MVGLLMAEKLAVCRTRLTRASREHSEDDGWCACWEAEAQRNGWRCHGCGGGE